jgi:hypothetical protein
MADQPITRAPRFVVQRSFMAVLIVVAGGIFIALSAFFVSGRYAPMSERMVLDRFTGEVRICRIDGCVRLSDRDPPPTSN